MNACFGLHTRNNHKLRIIIIEIIVLQEEGTLYILRLFLFFLWSKMGHY